MRAVERGSGVKELGVRVRKRSRCYVLKNPTWFAVAYVFSLLFNRCGVVSVVGRVVGVGHGHGGLVRVTGSAMLLHRRMLA